MKTKTSWIKLWLLGAVVLGLNLFTAQASDSNKSPDLAADKKQETIPWSQIGAKAGADYKGDGLAVSASSDGARLRCVFQRMEGEATREGLWLTSTVDGQAKERFRVTAAAVGRAGNRTSNLQSSTFNLELETFGKVSLDGQMVRFTRPGLVEEYTVSMDGVRQDFVVLEKPGSRPLTRPYGHPLPIGWGEGRGEGNELRLDLSVTGARVEQAAHGAQLVLEQSGRKIAYSRLKVTDANGKELPARFEVAAKSEIVNWKSETALAILVNAADATYPIRIDPTFSDADWIRMDGNSGPDGTVRALVTDQFGNLFIGGDFTSVDNVSASNIAKWDGIQWSSLGGGIEGGVNALAVSGTNLFVGGFFTAAGNIPANNIAKWNGIVWENLEEGIEAESGLVYALALSNDLLFVGGEFSTAGSLAANSIAKWDGTNWIALEAGVNGVVYTLVASGSDVYVGGEFTVAGNNFATNIAKWDGGTWVGVGAGLQRDDGYGWVSALTVWGSAVIAGGSFTASGETAVANIAKWDGSSWTAIGEGVDDSVQAVLISEDDLYVGGQYFSTLGADLLKWDGVSWSGLKSFGRVNALALLDGRVCVGGDFNYWAAADFTARNFAIWNGTNVVALSAGAFDPASPITVFGETLYACGDYWKGGIETANCVSVWNGSKWTVLGGGFDGGIYALTVLNNEVYAGGDFTMAAGISANSIARWDGVNWNPLGLGVGGVYSSVYALASRGGDLYVGGNFTLAGGVAVSGLAKWDGSGWSALSSGLNWVYALAKSECCLYAGGGNYVVSDLVKKWDGNSWTTLGLGLSDQVSDLAIVGDNIYACGWFRRATNANGSAVDCNFIAKWDGLSWSALGKGLDSYAWTLFASTGDLYVGGQFHAATNANSTSIDVNGIARWDGIAWSSLGSGVDHAVTALAGSTNGIYVVGWFDHAGWINSPRIAFASFTNAPPDSTPTLSSPIVIGNQIIFQLSGDIGSEYVVEATTSLAPANWQPALTNAAPFWFTNTIAGPQRFYRGMAAP